MPLWAAPSACSGGLGGRPAYLALADLGPEAGIAQEAWGFLLAEETGLLC